MARKVAGAYVVTITGVAGDAPPAPVRPQVIVMNPSVSAPELAHLSVINLCGENIVILAVRM